MERKTVIMMCEITLSDTAVHSVWRNKNINSEQMVLV